SESSPRPGWRSRRAPPPRRPRPHRPPSRDERSPRSRGGTSEPIRCSPGRSLEDELPDDAGRGSEVVHHVVGERGRAALDLLRSVSRPEQDGGRPDPSPHLDVASVVADDEGALEVEAVLAGRPDREAGGRLAAVAPLLGAVRADVDPEQLHPALAQDRAEAVVDAFETVGGEQAAPDGRL